MDDVRPRPTQLRVMHTIYKTTDLTNGKIYIGKHSTSKLDDGYMGSGLLLRRAIEARGVGAFAKEILHVFDTESEMNAKEAEIVTDEFCQRIDTYNICPGGNGGFGYINKNSMGVPNIRKDNAKQLAANGNAKRAVMFESDPVWSARYSKSMSDAGKRRTGDKGSFYGKRHTQEFKQMMSVVMSEAQSGEKNSQFGSFWATNGDVNIKVPSGGEVPDGYRRGRTILKNRSDLRIDSNESDNGSAIAA